MLLDVTIYSHHTTVQHAVKLLLPQPLQFHHYLLHQLNLIQHHHLNLIQHHQVALQLLYQVLLILQLHLYQLHQNQSYIKQFMLQSTILKHTQLLLMNLT